MHLVVLVASEKMLSALTDKPVCGICVCIPVCQTVRALDNTTDYVHNNKITEEF